MSSLYQKKMDCLGAEVWPGLTASSVMEPCELGLGMEFTLHPTA